MKKTFFFFSLITVISLASVAHAAGFVPLTNIPGLTSGATASQEGLANFLNNLYKYLIGLAAAIAVVEIIWGGIEYSTQDVPGSKQNGKDRIQGAILGLVLILSPVLVFSIINPSILNLSIGLPELDTKSNYKPASNIGQPLTEVRTGSMNAARVGQIIGYQEDYYIAPKSGGYCFEIASSETADGKNYFCSGEPNGCRTVYNDFNNRKKAVSECAKAP